ncbi:UGSC family (seleno)protein, partial [Chloroflexota bacterium]
MAEQTRWELVNPEGTVQLEPFAVKPHHQTLENKTVLLHWNAKHNGDLFLNKIAELLTEKVKGVKIIRGWEVAPE